MFERFTKAKSLESAQKIALSLLSEKGEANAQSIAAKFVEQFQLLDKPDDGRECFRSDLSAKWDAHELPIADAIHTWLP